MPNILLVEDNQTFANVATDYLSSQDNKIDLANDYQEALERLQHVDGVITDCFFPDTTNTGNITLGKELVEKMANSDPYERKINDSLKLLEEYIDMQDEEIRRYARSFIGNSEERDISKSPIFSAIKKVSLNIDKGIATMIAKNSLGLIYKNNLATKDYYHELIKAIDESEANQPLGLLVAERADELGLPVILATSTYHHDVLTQPVHNYASRQGWNLIDCSQPDDKATDGFWRMVWGDLEKRLNS